MNRKNTLGLYLNALSLILAVAGLVAYMMNTKTNYYAKMGVSTKVVAALAVAAVIELIIIVIGMKGTPAAADILPVLASVALVFGLVMLLNERINNLAAVFTFEASEANMADTVTCLVAIAVTVIAFLISLLASFFDVSKEV